MSFFMGIDAGGSKTYAAITDAEGKLLGIGRSGNGNHQINRELAATNIHSAVHEALAQAGLQKEQITYAWFGLAGADREVDFRILRPIIGELRLPHTDISCDTIISMRAGTSRPSGLVIICGTGVNCAGTNKHGVHFQCGGFGYTFGDFGGGGDLAVEVFRRAIRSWDGREQPTLLTKLIVDELGYANMDALVGDFLDHSRSIPVDLAKLLFTALEQGDVAAKQILTKQGEELGLAAVATIKQLHMQEDAFEIVLSGSILTRGDESGLLRGIIQERTQEIAPLSSVTTLNLEPVTGALILAYEHSGCKMTPQLYESLKNLNI